MNWPYRKIAEFCATGSGGTPSRQKAGLYYGGDIPWIKSGELKDSILFKTDETITKKGLEESSAKLIPERSILVAMYGATAGKTALLGINATTNQAICNIQPNPEIVENKFLWHFLKSNIKELLHKRIGGAQPNISQQIIKETKVPIPPISEQRRIVEILDQAERIRKLRADADAKAQRTLPALFIKMFGDAATNPMEWKLGKLDNIIKDTRNGLYKPAKFYGSGIGILKMFNIQSGELDLSRVDQIETTEKEYEAYCLLPGDILINRVNTPGLVGKCAVITEEVGKAVFESKNIRLRVKSSKATPEFIAYYINSPYGYRALRGGVKHAIGMATINNTDLRNTPVILPPIEIQNKWASIVKDFRKLSAKNSASKIKIDALFQNLVYRSFTGNLTNSWRKARMKELLQEMELQAKALAS